MTCTFMVSVIVTILFLFVFMLTHVISGYGRYEYFCNLLFLYIIVIFSVDIV